MSREVKSARLTLISIVMALLIVIVMSIVEKPIAHAQTSQPTKATDKNQRLIHESGQLVTYTHADLFGGGTTVTLPASLPTINSNTIDVTNAKEVAIFQNCGQIADLRIAVTDTDLSTVLNTYVPVTAIPAAWHIVTIGNEMTPGSTGGTVAAAVGLRTPLRGIQILANNTTATPSTCAFKVFVQY
jgi:hypothetical protein